MSVRVRSVPICPAFVFGLCTALLPLWAQTPAPSVARRKAPDFAFTQPEHGLQPLSRYQGKLVLLEFISTTCSHCSDAVATENRLQEEFGAKGFQALAVAINPNASVLVDQFASDHHLSFPSGWATRANARSVLALSPADRFVVPQIVLIDRQGNIAAQTAPQGDDDLRQESVLRQRIANLLHVSNLQPQASEGHVK